jgi:hypothetical protein
MKLFCAFVRPIFKDPNKEIKTKIEEILKKTWGHPLSIELIAKNIRSLKHNTEFDWDEIQSKRRKFFGL